MPFLVSDIISGFAGETDEDFETTRKNLEQSGLTQIHTFPYSIRQGTAGASMACQLDDSVKVKRASIVKDISAYKFKKFVEKNIGQIREVLIEKRPDKHDGKLKGVTRNYLTVHLNTDIAGLCNTIRQVKLTDYVDGKIYGELI